MSGEPREPGTPRNRRRVLVWMAVGLAAYVIGGSATAGVLALRDDDEGADRKTVAAQSESPSGDDRDATPERGSTSTASSPPPSRSPSASPDGDEGGSSTSPTAPALPSGYPTEPPDLNPGPTSAPLDDPDAGNPPDGYRTAQDPQGFSLAVPEGWEREVEGGQIDYRGPDAAGDSAYLRIGIVPGTTQSAIDHFRELEEITSSRTQDYAQVELAANTFQGRAGARWEFTWVEKKSGRAMHAIDQAYVTDDGTEYALYYQGPAESFATDRAAFDTALETWSQGG